MYLPVWAIVLLAIGWLGFLWLLIRRDSGGDLTGAPRMASRPAPPAPTSPPVHELENLPPELVAELRSMVAQGQKIHAIKRLRELARCGLAEAKDRVERL